MATEFRLFPELPREIQDDIWKLSLEVPRVIEIGETSQRWVLKGRVVDQIDFWKQIQITTNSPRTTLVPAALETCFRSRAVALEYYGRLLSARTWFNPAIDTLYFGQDWHHMEGLEHWRGLVHKNKEIRHIAFHLATSRYRLDFYYMTEVALKRHIKDITFIVDAPSDPTNNIVAPRFRSIGHKDIAGEKTLRAMGRFFRETQQHILTEAWNIHDTFFRRWGFYPDENSHPHRSWKMPKIKFMIEDETQARKTREDQQRQRELAAIKRAEAVPKYIDPETIDWNWTPSHNDFCPCPRCY